MKKLIIFLAVLVMAIPAMAVVIEKQGDGRMLQRATDIPQGFSPNGLYSSSSATNATFHNLTNFLAYDVYCASDCYIRLTPTAAKGTYPQTIVPGGFWIGAKVKNTATPFVNISSAAGAVHQWMQQ